VLAAVDRDHGAAVKNLLRGSAADGFHRSQWN
jgi:hypothetical protein